jgi:hypothetical protein
MTPEPTKPASRTAGLAERALHLIAAVGLLGVGAWYWAPVESDPTAMLGFLGSVVTALGVAGGIGSAAVGARHIGSRTPADAGLMPLERSDG